MLITVGKSHFVLVSFLPRKRDYIGSIAKLREHSTGFATRFLARFYANSEGRLCQEEEEEEEDASRTERKIDSSASKMNPFARPRRSISSMRARRVGRVVRHEITKDDGPYPASDRELNSRAVPRCSLWIKVRLLLPYGR